MTRSSRPFPLLLALCCLVAGVSAEDAASETDLLEPLPRLFPASAGAAAPTPEAWRHHRSEITASFERHVYGSLPEFTVPVLATTIGEPCSALDGAATLRQVRLSVGEAPGAPGWDVALWLPTRAVGRVPVVLGINFHGNHTLVIDRAVTMPAWVRDRNPPEPGAPRWVVAHRPQEAGRASHEKAWSIREIIARGYGLATFHCSDVVPDHPALFAGRLEALLRAGMGAAAPPADPPGAIAVWAWCASRTLDWLQGQADVDPARVAVMGHSRLGKTALWAGACDERFWMSIVCQSGQMGAALSRHLAGEKVADLQRAFPHWFTPAFARFHDAAGKLPPVDQHQLVALLAPRPLAVSSAIEDAWADPEGEFRSLVAAAPAWQLHGYQALPVAAMPPVDRPIADRVHYHCRSGGHRVTAQDWTWWLDFLDRQRPRQP